MSKKLDTPVHVQALERGIAFIKASGVTAYYIFDSAGKLHFDNGTAKDVVKAVKEVAPHSKNKTGRHLIHDFVKETEYIAQIDKMQPGDDFTWKRIEGWSEAKWTSFVMSVRSSASRRWGGVDSFAFSRDPKQCQLLRIS